MELFEKLEPEGVATVLKGFLHRLVSGIPYLLSGVHEPPMPKELVTMLPSKHK